jgi:hypothetical protein
VAEKQKILTQNRERDLLGDILEMMAEERKDRERWS